MADKESAPEWHPTSSMLPRESAQTDELKTVPHFVGGGHVAKKLVVFILFIIFQFWTAWMIYRVVGKLAVIVAPALWFAVIIPADLIPKIIHRRMLRTALKHDGFRLIQFSRNAGFVSYSFEWPWWKEYYDYYADVDASDCAESMFLHVAIEGALFGTVFRCMSCSFILDDNVPEVAVAQLIRLRGLRTLHHLNCNRCQLANGVLEQIGKMQNLVSLWISDTQIRDEDLIHLFPMTHLKSLELFETETTIDGRENLRKALPGCQVLPNP
jgi:hypothetical protein